MMEENFTVKYFRQLKRYHCLSFLVFSSLGEVLRGFIMTQGVAWGVNWIATGCLNQDFSLFLRGILAFSISIVIAVIMVHFLSIVNSNKMIALRSSLRTDMIEKVMLGDNREVKRFDKDDILFRYSNDIDDALKYYDGIGSFLGSFGKVLGGYIAGFMLSWQLSLILIAFGILKLFIDKTVMKPLSALAQKRNEEAYGVFSAILQFFQGIDFFRLAADRRKMQGQFEDNLEQLCAASYAGKKIEINIETLSNLLETVILLSIFIVSSALSMNGIVPIGAFAAFISLYDCYVNPYKFISNFLYMRKQHRVASEKIFEVLEIPISQRKQTKDYPLPENFALVGESLCFGYEQGKDVIHNLDFSFKSGTITYVTGSSGVGKSTLFGLINGLLQPQAGRIFLNRGEDHQRSMLDSSLITSVSQTPFLFTGTIAENIALVDSSEIDYDRLTQALDKAGILEYVKGLVDGSDYMIQESGKNQSGGQRCRLALARAFYRSTPIVLLDEVYASVDNVVISSIDTAIQALRDSNCCVVFITHRHEWIPDGSIVFNLDQSCGHHVQRDRALQKLSAN